MGGDVFLLLHAQTRGNVFIWHPSRVPESGVGGTGLPAVRDRDDPQHEG